MHVTWNSAVRHIKLWHLMILAVLILLAWLVNEEIHQNDPINIARSDSGLDIPDDVQILKFERTESGFPSGKDWSDSIVIQLSAEQSQRLQDQWREKGYGNQTGYTKDDPYISSSDMTQEWHTVDSHQKNISVMFNTSKGIIEISDYCC